MSDTTIENEDRGEQVPADVTTFTRRLDHMIPE